MSKEIFSFKMFSSKYVINAEIDSKLAWIRLFFVFILCATGFIGMWSVVMILPSIQNEFNVQRSSVVLPYIFTMIGFGIGNIIIGKYVDKHGINKPIIYALCLLIVTYFLSVISKNIMTLAIFQSILGFSSAVFFGPMMTDITKFFEEKRGLAVSIIASSQHFAGAIWPYFLEKFLIENLWRDSHMFIGISCLILFPPFYFLINKIKINNKIVSRSNFNESYIVKHNKNWPFPAIRNRFNSRSFTPNRGYGCNIHYFKPRKRKYLLRSIQLLGVLYPYSIKRIMPH